MNKLNPVGYKFRRCDHTHICIYWTSLGTDERVRYSIRKLYKQNRLSGMGEFDSRDKVLLSLLHNPIVCIRKAAEL